MDYTKLPPQLIYRTRKSLEDFTNNNEMNECIVDNMLEISYLQSSNFKERATACFNAAYYICTLILVDEHPEWSLPKYYDIALCNQRDNIVGQAITLSLVRTYLFHFDSDWNDKHKKLLNKLDDFINSHWIESGDPFLNDYSYKDAYEKINSFEVLTAPFSPTEFALRVIDQETIEELQISHFTWTQFTDYYKYNIMQDIVFHVGKNEDEMTLLVGSLRHDAEDFYSKDNPYFESICNRLGDIELKIYFHFHAAENEALMQAGIEKLKCQGDLSPLQARIAELENEVKNLREQLSGTTNPDIDQFLPELPSQKETNTLYQEQLLEAQQIIEEQSLEIQSYKDQGKGLSAPEAAILITSICLELNQVPANGREGLAPFIEYCWGKSHSTASEALRRKITEQSADKLARNFDDLTPKLARLIRELPQRLEDIKNERLMQINPNVNK